MSLIDISDQDLLYYWIIGAIILLPVTWLLVALLPTKFKRNKLRNLFFFYCLSVSIFLFGILVSLTIILLLHFYKFHRQKDDHISLAIVPEYQKSPITSFSLQGEGFGYSAITKNVLPKSMRQKMMITINKIGGAEVNQINASVLTDEIDEMRLYAQSLIEKQERAIIHQIKTFTQLIDTSHDPFDIAFYQKQLAHALWQQVFSSLVNKENATIVIDKIIAYSTEALAILKDDIELPLLLAKCELRKNHYEEAKRWLALAKENGSPDYKIMSYLAEIDFNQKDYQKVAELFRTKPIRGILRLEPVRKFWTTND